jgi:hypothetical protein
MEGAAKARWDLVSGEKGIVFGLGNKRQKTIFNDDFFLLVKCDSRGSVLYTVHTYVLRTYMSKKVLSVYCLANLRIKIYPLFNI